MTRDESLRWAYDFLAACRWDPEMFVRGAFSWGEPGTALADHEGPDVWQVESMDGMRRHLSNPQTRFTPYLEAIASGHGIGKSADIAWMVLWAEMTAPYCKGVVTANTQVQLSTKTWSEVAVWFNRLIPVLRDMFAMEATSLHVKGVNAKTWRIDATPWSATNTEAFQGLHNQGRRILIVFDEGSAIDDKIWEVTEGALTDANTEILWLVRGNPTRNDRRFRHCFAGGKFAANWISRKIDSRTVKITNKAQLQKWVDAYGEDHDFTRVRVRGEFPASNLDQLISEAVVDAAMKRVVAYEHNEAVVWGFDPARNGGDEAVLAKRRGRDAKSLPWKSWRGITDTMWLCDQIALEWREARALDVTPDAIFVDVGGLGGPVADRLRQMNIPNVYDATFGGAPEDVLLDNNLRMKAFNHGAAMWLNAREWLLKGAIPEDDELKAQLNGRQYLLHERSSAVQLESKADVRDRDMPSPDRADAFVLTFSGPVMPRIRTTSVVGQSNVTNDYDIHRDVR